MKKKRFVPKRGKSERWFIFGKYEGDNDDKNSYDKSKK